MSKYLCIDFIGFDFCFGNSPGFEGMGKLDGISLLFQEIIGGDGKRPRPPGQWMPPLFPGGRPDSLLFYWGIVLLSGFFPVRS